ncbi:S9 family peptidase [Myxococcus sp. RHSTA-1-4]|uniref:alpha/beta hydrolase family protein n=1 Tax=Myxococcus sp. RHSTA-1-4 TaxID=2874601 RepID=UPI001CC1274C|nr:alpha/beta fold hydrolase [Myxococcus sp. RHSTA-1-4]MBZ4422118.1 alpha/beta fold hydrolase [Myxococcus sp. RHSTA-1-4]
MRRLPARYFPLYLAAALLALTSGCRCTPAGEAAREDYAQARSGFKTTLLRKGPSPQEGEAVEALPGATRVTYRSGDLDLTAFVSEVPQDGKKHPAVLFLHGGFAFGQEDWEMSGPLREAGFVVMTPLLRGENGQPGTFSFFYDEVDDVLAAADALARVPGVDASRIYVSGHSVGGTLALLAAQSSRAFKAATSLSGSPDQEGFIEGREDIVPFAMADPREIKMRSPGAFASSFKCPTRLFFGSEESYFGEKSLKTALHARKAGLDVDAHSIPGDHFSSVPEGLQKSIAFFRAN